MAKTITADDVVAALRNIVRDRSIEGLEDKPPLHNRMHLDILKLAKADEQGNTAGNVVSRAIQFEGWVGQFERHAQHDAFLCLKMAAETDIPSCLAPEPLHTETVFERAAAFAEFLGLVKNGGSGEPIS